MLPFGLVSAVVNAVMAILTPAVLAKGGYCSHQDHLWPCWLCGDKECGMCACSPFVVTVVLC